jgi:hypothetical protein
VLLYAGKRTVAVGHRGRQNGTMVTEEVVTAFGLGEPVPAMTEAARGCGSYSVVYRLDSTDGRWAVKALR